jgi:hypothetical protein
VREEQRERSTVREAHCERGALSPATGSPAAHPLNRYIRQ